MRPPEATLQTDTPPQWVPKALVQPFGKRVATWALSRPTNFGEMSLAKLTRVGTGIWIVSPVSVTNGTVVPSSARKFGLSK